MGGTVHKLRATEASQRMREEHRDEQVKAAAPSGLGERDKSRLRGQEPRCRVEPEQDRLGSPLGAKWRRGQGQEGEETESPLIPPFYLPASSFE